MVDTSLFKFVEDENNMPVSLLSRLNKQEGLVVEINDGQIKKCFKED